MKFFLFKIGMLTTRVIHATKLAKAKGFDYLPNKSKPITKSQKDIYHIYIFQWKFFYYMSPFDSPLQNWLHLMQ
jgi:hypothetical protein